MGESSTPVLANAVVQRVPRPQRQIILVKFQHRGKWCVLGVTGGYTVKFDSPAILAIVLHCLAIESDDKRVIGSFCSERR